MPSPHTEGPTSRPARDGSYRPDPFRWLTTPHLSTWLRAAGFDVLLESNDPRIVDTALAVFHPEERPVDRAVTPQLRVRLMRDSLREDPEWRLRHPIVRTDGALMTLTYGRHNSVAIDAERGVAFGYVTDDLIDQPEFLRSEVAFAVVMCWVYVVTNAFAHAAALTRDGRSLMLRARSGAGKSTLSYALLRRGFRLIDDDAVYVHPCSDPLSRCLTREDAGFFGVPYRLQLLPDAGRFFPELARAPRITRPDGEEKVLIDVPRWFPGQCAPEAPAGPIVFLERGAGSRSRLRRLTRDEALDRLFDTSFAYEPTTTGEGTLWGLYLSFPSFVLESSGDPREAADVLDQAFATEFVRGA